MPLQVCLSRWDVEIRNKVREPVDTDNWRDLVFTMPNGTEIEIELFDRETDQVHIVIRTMDGSLIVEPEVTNCLRVRAERYEEMKGRKELALKLGRKK